MSSMYRWLVVATMFVVGFGLSACELSEDCDPAIDADCEVADGGGTDTATGDTGADTPVQFQTYHYVRITDLEDPGTSSPTSTSGADIDAVELVQNPNAGATSFFADQFHVCDFGSGDNDAARNCNFALGRPQNGCSPSAPDFVSLGGDDGGELIVSFPDLAEIREGDDIVVYECGAQQNPGAREEDYRISVGVSNTLNGFWEVCAPTATGIFTCTAANLDQIPLQ